MTQRFKMLVFVVVLLLVAAGGVVAAWVQQDDAEPVTILGTWTGTQEERFETLLRGFGIPFRYQGTAAQREVLLSKVQSGDPPDIVIMPGIGELAEYADQSLLKPLDGLYRPEEYGAPWESTGSRSEPVYWVPVKADLKSIVWYREGNRPAADAPAPTMENWCLGMGDDGASGWPGTDWIEDLVLQRAGPDAYERWALGKGRGWESDQVRTAWEAWAGLLGQNREVAEHALLTDHRDTPDGSGLLFDAWGGCTLEHQGSFAPSFYKDDAEKAGLTDSAPLLPGGNRRDPAHEVTGDFAALFSTRPAAGELIRRLASREGQQKWAELAEVYSANRGVEPQKGRVKEAITRRLRTGTRCLDASDVMAPAVRDAFYEAVLLTVARAAAGDEDVGVPGLLADVQLVQDAQSRRSGDKKAVPKTVCSAE